MLPPPADGAAPRRDTARALVVAEPVLIEEVRAGVNNPLDKRRFILENRFLQQSYQERLEASFREL